MPLTSRRRNPEGRMPLRDHLRELRRRVVLAAAGLLVGAVVGWLLYPPVIEALQQPLVGSGRSGLVMLNFPGVATALDIRVKVSLFVGVIVSSPWWLLQLWLFITPGLTTRERRYTLGFVGAAVPLFLGGTLLAWAALPNAVPLLLEFTPDDAANLTDAQMYMSFVMRVLLAFGIAFVLPVLMVVLSFADIVRAGTWLRGWRWAVVLVFAFGAIASPTPDVITMFMLALPMLALYLLAVGIAYLRERRRERRVGVAGVPA